MLIYQTIITATLYHICMTIERTCFSSLGILLEIYILNFLTSWYFLRKINHFMTKQKFKFGTSKTFYVDYFKCFDQVYLISIKVAAYFNIAVISTLCATVRKNWIYLMPIFLRYKREVFGVHIFMRVYSKSYKRERFDFRIFVPTKIVPMFSLYF